ncbi:MAG: YwiC-like family protein [Pyrinomonadaceae bacterium]
MEKRGAGRGVRVRTVALPVEHGGWGLTLEPVALGLLVAPSPVGFFLSVATMGAFLARHPLKIVAGDRRRGRRFPRTPVAERCAAIYAAVAAAGLLFAVLMADGYTFLWPLLLAAPLASVQLVYDAKGESRSLWPELAGAAALAGVATSIALAGGWKSVPAYGLWAVLIARAVPAILYVRARLNRLHGKHASGATVIAGHVAALAVVAALACAKAVPILAPAALAVLLLRAAHGLAESGPSVTARRIGIREIVYGALTVALVAASSM